MNLQVFKFANSIEAPLKQIVKNAGGEGAVIVSKVKEGKNDFGYNAKLDKFENLFKSGIIDPTKVTRVALENANSVAGMLLTTECVLADIKEERPTNAWRWNANGWRYAWYDVNNQRDLISSSPFFLIYIIIQK